MGGTIGTLKHLWEELEGPIAVGNVDNLEKGKILEVDA
jgi:hypothetical protein